MSVEFNMEYAPGIPKRGYIAPILPISSPKVSEYYIQKHDALRAGSHYDLRLNINGQSLTSWAVRSLPKPGEKVLAARTFEHSQDYGMYSGFIPSGYGAGKVELFAHDKVEILKSDPSHILFNVYETNGSTSKYALIKLDEKQWLFNNITATEKNRPFVPLTKSTIKQIDINKVDINNSNQVIAPKYDGALSTFVLRPQKPIEAYSYRKSKRVPGQLIDYSFKTELYKTIVPPAIKGTTILRGELFGATPQDTNAVLLSGVWRARTLPKLQHRLFDVEKFQGKDYRNKPYAEKLQALKFIAGAMPNLQIQELKSSPEAKKALIDDIRKGTHPHTKEGVVVYDLDRPYPTKAKFVQDSNVYLTEILGGKGRLHDSTGRLGYSLTANGPTKGYIGTGLSDTLRRTIFAEPDEFIGKQVQITSEKQFPSGAFKVPVFKAFA